MNHTAWYSHIHSKSQIFFFFSPMWCIPDALMTCWEFLDNKDESSLSNLSWPGKYQVWGRLWYDYIIYVQYFFSQRLHLSILKTAKYVKISYFPNNCKTAWDILVFFFIKLSLKNNFNAFQILKDHGFKLTLSYILI